MTRKIKRVKRKMLFLSQKKMRLLKRDQKATAESDQNKDKEHHTKEENYDDTLEDEKSEEKDSIKVAKALYRLL